MARKIEVVPYNPDWPRLYSAEAESIAAALGGEMTAIHHIGSTAIPGIKAKPVLDFLVAVHRIEKVDQHNGSMIALGYEPRGEYGIPGRRYFIKHTAGTRSHHVHIFQNGNSEITRHLNFRDYIRAHPDEARAYSRLKEDLARQHPEDSRGYNEGKNEFVQEIDQRAKVWKNTQS